ncbi:MAG: maltose alpha-D-glucosyltransferase [Verrucomicrobia bacterium]|nr:maltose alpha-D-glucosyltransferase [Verrucomicrobiota bacterium]
MTDAKRNRGVLAWEPQWYKSGVIYEVHVRAFQDSDGNGTGDFRGLTTKLDYLRDLGVTALWLLPFYPSPLRDDGYDIADYYNVHPMYGTLSDFKVFLREAHRRGLRVITELVLNHTSEQHPWFQRARRAKPGSRHRDFYVWSDTAEEYKGTRIIFKDTETSNWTWDPVAKAHFWHRFYSHQPDLNFDNPVVHQEVLKVVDFWLDLGVDGLRLDAVPYLYEREGTSCENLPETHEYLRGLRQHVDQKYGDRMLLGEANQWPEDAVKYFGGGVGDECHMTFHFPLMPRLFMALRMEDRVPIVDILQQTPPIPETAQWALFLRNHDELTLEMVTDEERDYMYRVYAHVHQARLNLGIRRRLAPLLGNDRKRIELLNALLFSLPGTPVLYYGDEIGMGENIYLGDRNGVRTPMQWSADRNAGFSRASTQSLYLPINLDPENHYEAVNVDVQQRNPHSLLWWMKRLIALHKRWKAFGLGTLEFLEPENRKILMFLRHYQDQSLLMVANLSRFVQPVAVDLSRFGGRVPVELFGRTEFPPITDRPYFLTLSPHAFYWFSLEAKPPSQADVAVAPPRVEGAPPLAVSAGWEEVFGEKTLPALELALSCYLPARRWFGGKAKAIKGVHIQETVPVPLDGKDRAVLALLRVDYVQSESERYCLPLSFAAGEEASALQRECPGLVVVGVQVARAKLEGVLYDAVGSKGFCQAILELIGRRRTLKGSGGELEASPTAFFRQMREAGLPPLEPAISRAEQSNSSVIYGDRLILKFFRKLDVGVNPDLDIARFLTARKFPNVPGLAGSLMYRRPNGELLSVAILSAFVPQCKDAWVYTLDTLSRYFDRVQSLPVERQQAPGLPGSPLEVSGAELPPQALDMIGTYVASAELLGERTAALHLALAGEAEDKEFTPEPLTPHYVRGLFQSMRNLMRQNFQLLAKRLKGVPESLQADAQRVLGLEPEILKRFSALYQQRISAMRIRHHGDYHLGQVLYTGKDFLIIDFEGEPARALSERRLKRSPLRDVAGMLRSFHYAAYAALFQQIERGNLGLQNEPLAASWARFWYHWVSVAFLKAYRRRAGAAPFMPRSDEEFQIMMNAYLLEKAVYELGYELNNRPTWLRIPFQGILQLLDEPK